MKTSIASLRNFGLLGLVAGLSASTLRGADATATTDTAAPATAAASATVTASAPATKLPYGAGDVLKLSRAQVSDDVILNYVQSSGTIYNLSPQDIVYMKSEGVSDRVVNAMLGQRKQVEIANQQAAAASAQAAAAPAIQNAPTVPDAPLVPVAPQYVDAAPYVDCAPASSVYVIPSPTVRAAYYGYYSPYYYSSPYRYYGPSYYGPSVSFGFRFGGGGGHYRGGGGWHHR
jgi:hypothetical protein